MTEAATIKQAKFMDALGVLYDEYTTKQEAKVLIQKALEQQDPKPATPKEVKPTNGSLPMYVSYAKDIFCAFADKPGNAEVTMTQATDLVKQAMKELSAQELQ